MGPPAAQSRLTGAWQTDRHTVWEIDWPDAPVGGPVTVETWQAGARYRYEILESTAPALVGQVLVFDGHRAWRYDRFQTQPALPQSASPPLLSPVTDAFAVIDRLLITSPASAVQQQTTILDYGPVQKIELTFEQGDTLTFWLEPENGFPVRIIFLANGSRAELHARQVEPLVDPPAKLFTPFNAN